MITLTVKIILDTDHMYHHLCWVHVVFSQAQECVFSRARRVSEENHLIFWRDVLADVTLIDTGAPDLIYRAGLYVGIGTYKKKGIYQRRPNCIDSYSKYVGESTRFQKRKSVRAFKKFSMICFYQQSDRIVLRALNSTSILDKNIILM